MGWWVGGRGRRGVGGTAGAVRLLGACRQRADIPQYVDDAMMVQQRVACDDGVAAGGMVQSECVLDDAAGLGSCHVTGVANEWLASMSVAGRKCPGIGPPKDSAWQTGAGAQQVVGSDPLSVCPPAKMLPWQSVSTHPCAAPSPGPACWQTSGHRSVHRQLLVWLANCGSSRHAESPSRWLCSMC